MLKKSAPDYGDWILDKLKEIAALTREEISEECLWLTVRELLDTEQYKLEKAFAMARKECKFFPRPCEIFEFIKRDSQTLIIGRTKGPQSLEEQIEEVKKIKRGEL
jgi:hypothetical protein